LTASLLANNPLTAQVKIHCPTPDDLKRAFGAGAQLPDGALSRYLGDQIRRRSN